MPQEKNKVKLKTKISRQRVNFWGARLELPGKNRFVPPAASACYRSD
jgi:hypothetical protein